MKNNKIIKNEKELYFTKGVLYTLIIFLIYKLIFG